MPYEWDEAKQHANRLKHDIDFDQADAFGWDAALVERDLRSAEPRFRAYGYIGARLHVLVFTWRGDNIRVISLRKANPREMTRYASSEAWNDMADA